MDMTSTIYEMIKDDAGRVVKMNKLMDLGVVDLG